MKHPSGGLVAKGPDASNVPAPRSVTYTDFDNPFAFVDNSSGAPHISRLSANAWVGCGNDIYILELLGKGFIRVQPTPKSEGKLAWSSL